MAGALWIGLIPVAALLISAIIEIVHHSMTNEERTALSQRFDREIEEAKQRIEHAQSHYEHLHMLCVFTAEQEYQYRAALHLLGDHGIWYEVRNGLMTSVFIRAEDVERAESALGMAPEQVVDQDAAQGGTPGVS